MVKLAYACEFSGCGKVYDSSELAEECESQGISGPEIRPGLILGEDADGGYSIGVGTFPNGHFKTYKFISIMDSLELLEMLEKQGDKTSHEPNFRQEDYHISCLESMINKGNLRLLDEAEFRKISNLIHHGKKLDFIRTSLNRRGISRFYRTHSHFNSST